MRTGEQDVEMVVDPPTLDSILESNILGDSLGDGLETEDLSVWVHEEPVPHQIAIMDERLCLGAVDESGMPVAVLETENAAAVAWAHDFFEEHREASRRLEPGDV